MEIEITSRDQEMVARLIGRLDTPASQEVAPKFQPLLDNADRTVVMDCSELSYISSSGLRLFLTLRKACSAKGGKVVLRGISDEIRQVFTMTGLLALFVVEDA